MAAAVNEAKRDIVVVGTMAPGFADRLGARWTLHQVPVQDGVAGLSTAARGSEVAIAAGRFGREALDALPGLRFVLNAGIGYDQLDLPALRARDVAIANLARVASDCVADMAMALLLDVARCTTRGHRFVAEGRWGREAFPFVHRLSGKRLGILSR